MFGDNRFETILYFVKSNRHSTQFNFSLKKKMISNEMIVNWKLIDQFQKFF